MNICRTIVFLLGSLGWAALLAQQSKQPPPAPLSNPVNRQLPSWLRLGGEERTRMENISGAGFKDAGDSYLLNRLRLSLEARPARWLKFGFEAQDSRVFGQNTRPAPASQKNAMDLRAGYVEAGSEEGPVTLRAGRQSLAFGAGRLLADPDWSNVGRGFDAVPLTLRGGGREVDLFTGAVVKGSPVDFDRPAAGAHFHGAYGSLDRLVPRATLEPFLFWRLEHGYKIARPRGSASWTPRRPA